MRMLIYIDPGTGSMLFAAALGIASTVHFLCRKVWMQIKYRIPMTHSGEAEDVGTAENQGIIIFSEGKQYYSSFKGICDELEKRRIACEYWTMDDGDAILKEEYKYVRCIYIGSGNRAYARLNLMEAGVCLATTPGLDVYQWKRSSRVGEYVHIFHSIDEGLAYRMLGLDFYDTILLVGDFQERYIRMVERARGLAPKKMKVVGCPYMDELLTKKNAGIDMMADERKKKTVLLAPSWGEESIFHTLGEELLDALLDSSFDVIIRPHPQSLIVEKAMIERLQKKYSADKITWDLSKDNFVSLMKADILISDFSSVVFDFLFVFEKPVVYADAHIDFSVFDSAWIDEPVWKYQVMKEYGHFLQKEELPQLDRILQDIIERYSTDEKIKNFMRDTWQYQGEAAVKIVDYLTETGE